MFRTFILTILLCCPILVVRHPAVAFAYEARQQDDFYTSVTSFLQRHVAKGNVKYSSLQKDIHELNKLANEIAQYNLGAATASEKKAFYINAYNLLVLKQVMEHYPVKSVMDVPGFFDKKKYKVAGENLTLNELENKKLRLPFKDARIHFALVCAAKSCPPLLNRAYTPQLVEKQLESQTKLALQNPAFTKVLPQQKKVQVSELFKWYEEDFLAEATDIVAYINKYRSKPVPKYYTVEYYTYNWALNELQH